MWMKEEDVHLQAQGISGISLINPATPFSTYAQAVAVLPLRLLHSAVLSSPARSTIGPKETSLNQGLPATSPHPSAVREKRASIIHARRIILLYCRRLACFPRGLLPFFCLPAFSSASQEQRRIHVNLLITYNSAKYYCRASYTPFAVR